MKPKFKEQKPEFSFRISLFRHLETMRKRRMMVVSRPTEYNLRMYKGALELMRDFLSPYQDKKFLKKWRDIETKIKETPDVPFNAPKAARIANIKKRNKNLAFQLDHAFALLMQLLDKNQLLIGEKPIEMEMETD